MSALDSPCAARANTTISLLVTPSRRNWAGTCAFPRPAPAVLDRVFDNQPPDQVVPPRRVRPEALVALIGQRRRVAGITSPSVKNRLCVREPGLTPADGGSCPARSLQRAAPLYAGDCLQERMERPGQAR